MITKLMKETAYSTVYLDGNYNLVFYCLGIFQLPYPKFVIVQIYVYLLFSIMRISQRKTTQVKDKRGWFLNRNIFTSEYSQRPYLHLNLYCIRVQLQPLIMEIDQTVMVLKGKLGWFSILCAIIILRLSNYYKHCLVSQIDGKACIQV